jgi:hypothetical protein
MAPSNLRNGQLLKFILTLIAAAVGAVVFIYGTFETREAHLTDQTRVEKLLNDLHQDFHEALREKEKPPGHK